MVYGNSSAEPTTVSFADFRGAPNARIQSFSYFTSEAEERFAAGPGLAGFADRDRCAATANRRGANWRDILTVADQFRERRVAGKAVLLTDAG